MSERQRKVQADSVGAGRVPTKPERAAVRVFAANERMNQMLLQRLEPKAWKAKTPGGARTIAAIFTHMHNVRTKWVRLTARGLGVPKQLDRSRCTIKQAQSGLAESAAHCEEMLAEALGDAGRVKKFVRDGWARPWPVGVEMLCYMIAHEAHHRGQVLLLARLVGYPLPKEVGYGMWNWEKIWRERGASGPGKKDNSRKTEEIAQRSPRLQIARRKQN
jgi:uncharacterized damage-inducible protein DinB